MPPMPPSTFPPAFMPSSALHRPPHAQVQGGEFAIDEASIENDDKYAGCAFLDIHIGARRGCRRGLLVCVCLGRGQGEGSPSVVGRSEMEAAVPCLLPSLSHLSPSLPTRRHVHRRGRRAAAVRPAGLPGGRPPPAPACSAASAGPCLSPQGTIKH